MCNLSVPQAKAELRDQAACHKRHPKEGNQILLMRGLQLVQHLFFFYNYYYFSEGNHSQVTSLQPPGCQEACWMLGVCSHWAWKWTHVDSTAVKMQ